MRLYVLVFILSLLCHIHDAYGQNLVTNPGFEEKYKCPESRSEIIYLPIYNSFPSALDWVSPVNTTPDYFNTCAAESSDVKLPYLILDGYHKAHNGEACAGISMFSGHPLRDTIDHWSEYLETRLSAPLQAGHDYYISYYVVLTTHAQNQYNIISVDNIGARLTAQMIDTTCAGPMFYVNGPPDIQTPPGFFITDTANWTLVSGIYHAKGGEQWLTIGYFYSGILNYRAVVTKNTNFDAISSACYMLVDDVCAIDMDSPVTTDSELFTPQFPITIGMGKAAGTYLWDNGDTSLQIEVPAPGTYVRQRWSECGYYVDSFRVKEVPADYCVWLPTAFTPNGDGKNDLFGPGNGYCHPDFSDFSFNIYNRWGQLVFQTVDPGVKWDGKWNGIPQEMGVYYYTLRYEYRGAFASQNAAPGKSTILRGDVTLVR